MALTSEEAPLPVFELDQLDRYRQYVLTNSFEIRFYLNQLNKKRSIATAYLDEGRSLFLTSVVAVDEKKNQILLDPAHDETMNRLACNASRITVATHLDRVKIQFRLPSVTTTSHQGQRALCANIPESLLRLQRREYFRLEPPLGAPVFCKVTLQLAEGTTKVLDMPLSDISAGGVSLVTAVENAEHICQNMPLPDCRLDIPGEGVITVNLEVRKTVEVSNRSGQHHLRIGCEFIDLSSARQAMIERYITKIERERKARDSGLMGE
jgi:c-di-GMP-binding flagellar brake protein YcgR